MAGEPLRIDANIAETSGAWGADPGSFALIQFHQLEAEFHPKLSKYGETHEKLRAPPENARTRPRSFTKKWTRTRQLGKGLTKVWLEESHDIGNSQRVVKVISKKPKSYRRSGADYGKEIAALCHVQQPKFRHVFVNFHGWFESPDSIFLCMEYLPLGDLVDAMLSDLGEEDVRVIAAQLADGLYVLHEDGWVHRDVKPENVYVEHSGPDWRVKIGDFGISERSDLSRNTALKTVGGTTNYVAPETIAGLLKGNAKQSAPETSADMWSLGALTYYLLTGYVPFSKFEELKYYCRSIEPLPSEQLVEKDISEPGQDFVESLLMPDPDKRLTASSALDHLWFANLVVKDSPLVDLEELSSGRNSQVSRRLDKGKGRAEDGGQVGATAMVTHEDDLLSVTVEELPESEPEVVNGSRPRFGLSDKTDTEAPALPREYADNQPKPVKRLHKLNRDLKFADEDSSDVQKFGKAKSAVRSTDTTNAEHPKEQSGLSDREAIGQSTSSAVKKTSVKSRGRALDPTASKAVIPDLPPATTASSSNIPIPSRSARQHKVTYSPSKADKSQPGGATVLLPSRRPQAAQSIAKQASSRPSRKKHEQSRVEVPEEQKDVNIELQDLQQRQRRPYTNLHRHQQPSAPSNQRQSHHSNYPEVTGDIQRSELDNWTQNKAIAPIGYWPQYGPLPYQQRSYAYPQNQYHQNYMYPYPQLPQQSAAYTARNPMNSTQQQWVQADAGNTGIPASNGTSSSHPHGSAEQAKKPSKTHSFDFSELAKFFAEERAGHEAWMAKLLKEQEDRYNKLLNPREASEAEHTAATPLKNERENISSAVNDQRPQLEEVRATAWQQGRLAGMQEAQLLSSTDQATRARREQSVELPKEPASSSQESERPVVLRAGNGRRILLPYAKCRTWFGMQSFMHLSFRPFETAAMLVADRQYNLKTRDNKIILPEAWEDIVTPGMTVEVEFVYPPEESDEESSEEEEEEQYGRVIPEAPPVPTNLQQYLDTDDEVVVVVDEEGEPANEDIDEVSILEYLTTTAETEETSDRAPAGARAPFASSPSLRPPGVEFGSSRARVNTILSPSVTDHTSSHESIDGSSSQRSTGSKSSTPESLLVVKVPPADPQGKGKPPSKEDPLSQAEYSRSTVSIKRDELSRPSLSERFRKRVSRVPSSMPGARTQFIIAIYLLFGILPFILFSHLHPEVSLALMTQVRNLVSFVLKPFEALLDLLQLHS